MTKIVTSDKLKEAIKTTITLHAWGNRSADSLLCGSADLKVLIGYHGDKKTINCHICVSTHCLYVYIKPSVVLMMLKSHIFSYLYLFLVLKFRLYFVVKEVKRCTLWTVSCISQDINRTTFSLLHFLSPVGCLSDDSISSSAGNRQQFIAVNPPFLSTSKKKSNQQTHTQITHYQIKRYILINVGTAILTSLKSKKKVMKICLWKSHIKE